MEQSSTLIWLGANFGFAAITTVVILAVYVKLVNRVVEIVKQNTEAFTRLEQLVRAVLDKLDRR